MCGIAGLIAPPDSRIFLEHQGKLMIDSLVHRGPDSHGMWVNNDEGLVLVHDRLAIQDISTNGNQPMWSNSGRYCIAFNGEIYNFRVLADELRSYGYNFKGHSDTEVLLAAIEKWGLTGAVQRSIGMFAFAIWDSSEKLLSLCRDRLGEKPLYYGWIDHCFYFASELKALESITSYKKLAIDLPGMADFLRYGYISAPYSIYQGVYKLIPGTIFSFSPRKILNQSGYSPCPGSTKPCPVVYWSARTVADNGLQNPFASEEEAIEKLDTLLHQTVNMQKIADVNVGVFLSGGIDSSTVAAIAQHESMDRIRTFSIGFDEQEYDESAYAEMIARHLGTDHATINVSAKDTLQIVHHLPYIFDEPFADSSQIPTYILSKFAREKVTVCLSGDGGDELFAGYNRYLATDKIWNRINSIPYPLRKTAGQILEIPGLGFWDHLYKLFQANRNGKQSYRLVGLKLQKLAGLLQQDNLMNGYDYLLSYWNEPQKIIAQDYAQETGCSRPILPETESFIDKALYLDQTHYLPGDNLAKVDRASMAVSLETRLPLLNHQLVELSWRIPVSMKVRGASSKWILRQVLYRYVPPELLERPKMGFSVPIARWLRNELRTWAEDLLALIGTAGYEILVAEPIYKAWREHLSGKRDHSQRLWTILMLLSWMQSRA